MTEVFLDSDVILDFLLKREKFAVHAATIFALGEQRVLRLHTSTVSFLNVNYIAESQIGHRDAVLLIRKLRSLVTLQPVDERTVDWALSKAGGDLEDYVQYRAAKDGQLDFLVTRNVADYPKEPSFVMTPALLLKTLPRSGAPPPKGRGATT
ncbi:MAG: PIN domain-containing protein [Candidatus Eisenbacteria bacterium]|nr:PIN domain-containing protein [Candidatus Eisenbacteria bacterium]